MFYKCLETRNLDIQSIGILLKGLTLSSSLCLSSELCITFIAIVLENFFFTAWNNSLTICLCLLWLIIVIVNHHCLPFWFYLLYIHVHVTCKLSAGEKLALQWKLPRLCNVNICCMCFINSMFLDVNLSETKKKKKYGYI